jgi:hypothetical protein
MRVGDNRRPDAAQSEIPTVEAWQRMLAADVRERNADDGFRPM